MAGNANQGPGRIVGAARQPYQVGSFVTAALDQVTDAQQAEHGLLAPLQGASAAADYACGKVALLLDHGGADGLDQHGWIAARRYAPACHARQPDQQRSEEHTSELQSLMRISYAVFCLKKKNKTTKKYIDHRTYTNTNLVNTK